MEVFLDHLKGERSGALDRFTKELIRVGRNADFELCFDDLGVSFEHAELRLRDGDFWLVDRGSTNGSYVNEERAYNARLRDGDVVRFGKKGPVVRFTLAQPRPEESAASREAADAAELVRKSNADDEPLADLPPLAPAPEEPIGVPQKKGRSRRLTVPNMPSLEPQREPERSPDAPKIAIRPIPEPESSSADSLSSGGSSSLEERRAGERRISVMARPQTRGFWMALAFLSVGTVFFAGAATMFYIDSDRKSHLYDEARHDLEGKIKELDTARKERADAEEEWRNREARAQEVARRTIDNLEGTLAREREEAKRTDRANRVKIEDLSQENGRLKAELQGFQGVSASGGDGRAWKNVQKQLARSVVLVAVNFNLKRRDGTTEPVEAYGSGFFVSKEGHIITNKHVVEPWKFRPMATRIATDDLEVDAKSYSLAVWIAGTRFASGSQLDVTTGYSTQQKTLEKLRTPRDVMTSVSVPGDKGPRTVLVHNDNSNEDLALLKATGGPFEPIALRRPADGPVEKLDPIMVLGFPAGPKILEAGKAETSPSLGTIRKVEETIYVNASIMGGNSGGPVVDTLGRVIGVATRIVNAPQTGTEALGICLKVEHVIDLYDNGN